METKKEWSNKIKYKIYLTNKIKCNLNEKKTNKNKVL